MWFSDIIVWSCIHWLTNNCHPTAAAPTSPTSIIDAHSLVLNTWEPFLNGLLWTLSLPHCLWYTSGSVSQMSSWSCPFVATQLVQLLRSLLLSVEHLGASFLNCPQFTPDTFPSHFPHWSFWLSLSGDHPHCPSPLTPKSLIYCRHFSLLTACGISWVLFPSPPLRTIIIHPLWC